MSGRFSCQQSIGNLDAVVKRQEGSGGTSRSGDEMGSGMVGGGAAPGRRRSCVVSMAYTVESNINVGPGQATPRRPLPATSLPRG